MGDFDYLLTHLVIGGHGARKQKTVSSKHVFPCKLWNDAIYTEQRLSKLYTAYCGGKVWMLSILINLHGATIIRKMS